MSGAYGYTGQPVEAGTAIVDVTERRMIQLRSLVHGGTLFGGFVVSPLSNMACNLVRRVVRLIR